MNLDSLQHLRHLSYYPNSLLFHSSSVIDPSIILITEQDRSRDSQLQCSQFQLQGEVTWLRIWCNRASKSCLIVLLQWCLQPRSSISRLQSRFIERFSYCRDLLQRAERRVDLHSFVIHCLVRAIVPCLTMKDSQKQACLFSSWRLEDCLPMRAWCWHYYRHAFRGSISMNGKSGSCSASN